MAPFKYLTEALTNLGSIVLQLNRRKDVVQYKDFDAYLQLHPCVSLSSSASDAAAATEDATSNYSSRLSPSYLSAAEQSRSLRRSSSSEVMRQLTRLATMKRSTKRSTVNTRSSCASQLDAIQRGQKLLDARLQDIQTASGKKDETVVKENVLHVRHLLTETQRALDILVKSMASTQNAIQTMATVVTAIYNKMSTAGQGDTI